VIHDSKIKTESEIEKKKKEQGKKARNSSFKILIGDDGYLF
jgi:hypothetical protein